MRYSLGLDIGIASVGWCVLDLDKEKVAGLGVRTFAKAENPKDGASLALPRREARSARRRLARRRKRLDDVQKLLQNYKIEPIFLSNETTPYQLRAEGLDRLLASDEWGRALFHIAKRRGFKSNRKSEANEKEAGALLAGVGENARILIENGYRTVGEMLQKNSKFEAHKRNKSGQYKNTLSRALLEEEIKKLFDAQRTFGSEYATTEMETAYLEIFARQKPFATAEEIIAKVGNCTFEPSKKRAPKSSYTSEYFRLLQNVNNMRIINGGRERELLLHERAILAKEAHDKVSLKYSQVRKKLELDDEEVFNISYSGKKGESREETEKKTFAEMKSFHEMRKELEKMNKTLKLRSRKRSIVP